MKFDPDLTAEKPGLYGATTGRGEAQTLRLSMLFALLNGSAVIETSHLQAANAVWDYCDDSASIIFRQDDDQEDPLQTHLLKAIRKQPGINRRGLHRMLGGHIPADMLVKALAALRDRKLAFDESEATGGRPAECWYPSNPVEIVMADPEDGGAKRDASEVDQQESHCEQTSKGDALHDRVCSFARIMSLAELLDGLNAIGAKMSLNVDDVKFSFPRGSNGTITPQLMAAISYHKPKLLEMVKQMDASAPVKEDDFVAELVNAKETPKSNGEFIPGLDRFLGV